MPDYSAEMMAIVGAAPYDLVQYYEAGDFPSFPESRVNCLSFEAAAKYTFQIAGIPTGHRMGLWVLDDANDSNPFCYISKGPCMGAIIRFSHDPEPEIYFPKLNPFLAALTALGISGADIDELKKAKHMGFALSQRLAELCGEDTEDSVFLICTYLPVCADLGEDTKKALSVHEDFFVREAFAAYLTEHPSVDDLAFAEVLASDKHPQVARPGAAARSAINRIKWSG